MCVHKSVERNRYILGFLIILCASRLDLANYSTKEVVLLVVMMMMMVVVVQQMLSNYVDRYIAVFMLFIEQTKRETARQRDRERKQKLST